MGLQRKGSRRRSAGHEPQPSGAMMVRQEDNDASCAACMTSEPASNSPGTLQQLDEDLLSRDGETRLQPVRHGIENTMAS